MKFNGKELSKKIIEKALACKTAEELMATAKAEGINLTKAEAEAYLSEMADVELTDEELKQAAGGYCWEDTHAPCQSNVWDVMDDCD